MRDIWKQLFRCQRLHFATRQHNEWEQNTKTIKPLCLAGLDRLLDGPEWDGRLRSETLEADIQFTYNQRFNAR